jgi:hypothetical protein
MGPARRPQFWGLLQEQHLLPGAGSGHPLSGRRQRDGALLAYGNVSFASKAGPLSGNDFLTLTEGLENIYALGRKTLLERRQDIWFELG